MAGSYFDKGRDIVISFEDLFREDAFMGPLPQGYAGCSWCDDAWFFTRRVYPAASIDGRVGIFNADGHDLVFDRPEPFHFKSLKLSSLWRNNVEVLLEGWEKDDRKYATPLTLQRNPAIQVDLNYRDVDRVVVRTNGRYALIGTIVLAPAGTPNEPPQPT